MEAFKHKWKKTPATVRKPIILIVGIIFILASIATGWLPGPGGIPLFLIGIAILASEFAWAERIRDRILGWLHRIGQWFKRNKVLGILLCIAGAAGAGYIFYLLYIA